MVTIVGSWMIEAGRLDDEWKVDWFNALAVRLRWGDELNIRHNACILC